MDSLDLCSLKSALDDLNAQFSWSICQSFIANLTVRIPELVEHADMINEVALQTLESVNLSINIASFSKPTRSDVETCQKVLQSGVNKGKKCSLLRIANSNHCTRHMNMMLKSNLNNSDAKEKQISAFRDLVGATKQQRKTTVQMELRPVENVEDIYVDIKTHLIFETMGTKVVAVGHMYSDEMQLLSKADIKLYVNGWEYLSP